ncbi:DnaA/Hda family protein [Candidatus Nucleicultrix amoebiphila]|jgi:chromosomal replication initiation ATPase DnaA|uniref:DnaA/Hda family protein n=1 Tax=Candidatus Nucleicultrix amoebiphila TaxID=1509244 RepID=UPI000A2687D6|nr:DnaA/Hda family protein [Candidatus Nucleicultrix amoebiphila]
MTSRQFTFSLPHQETYTSETFFQSTANSNAYQWVNRWPEWPGQGLVIYGPPGSGKTHLAHVWQKKAQAIFLENFHNVQDLQSNVVLDGFNLLDYETDLFHFYNTSHEQKRFFLICTETPPNHWKIQLADLRSRLLSLPTVGLENPDDALLRAVLMKKLADLQLRVSPKTLDYLLTRMPRTFETLHTFISTLNQRSLAEGQKINIQTIRKVLESKID